MVLAGKVFRLREKTDLSDIEIKLKNFRKVGDFNEENLRTKLVTEVRNLLLREDMLEGTYAEDKVFYTSFRGETIAMPRTIEIPFVFSKYKGIMLLVVMEKKLIANNLANRLSDIMYNASGYIMEVRITPEVLRIFHEKNPDNTKVIFFNDVDLPNISKLSLYGSELLNTSLYNEYINHGNIWYIVVTSRFGSTVGITRNCIVTIFNNIDEKDFLKYVMGELFPLIQL